MQELDLFSRLLTEGLDPKVHPFIGDVKTTFVLQNKSRGVTLAVDVIPSVTDTTNAEIESREAFLQSRGFTVERVSTRSIRETPAQVVHRIKRALEVA